MKNICRYLYTYFPLEYSKFNHTKFDYIAFINLIEKNEFQYYYFCYIPSQNWIEYDLFDDESLIRHIIIC